MWARGYFCATVGTVTEEMIANYIEHQALPEMENFQLLEE